MGLLDEAWERGRPYREALGGLLHGDLTPAKGLLGVGQPWPEKVDPAAMKEQAYQLAMDWNNPVGMLGMMKTPQGLYPENIADVEKLQEKLRKHLTKNNIPFVDEAAGYLGGSKYFTIGKNLDEFKRRTEQSLQDWSGNSAAPAKPEYEDLGLLRVRIADHWPKYDTDLSLHPLDPNAYRPNDSYEEVIGKVNEFVQAGGVKPRAAKPSISQEELSAIQQRNAIHTKKYEEAKQWVAEQMRNRPAGMSRKEFMELGIKPENWPGWKE